MCPASGRFLEGTEHTEVAVPKELAYALCSIETEIR
jgi:hypothetical protein